MLRVDGPYGDIQEGRRRKWITIVSRLLVEREVRNRHVPEDDAKLILATSALSEDICNALDCCSGGSRMQLLEVMSNAQIQNTTQHARLLHSFLAISHTKSSRCRCQTSSTACLLYPEADDTVTEQRSPWFREAVLDREPCPLEYPAPPALFPKLLTNYNFGFKSPSATAPSASVVPCASTSACFNIHSPTSFRNSSFTPSGSACNLWYAPS